MLPLPEAAPGPTSARLVESPVGVALKGIKQTLKKHGYVLDKLLGSGVCGTVYSGLRVRDRAG